MHGTKPEMLLASLNLLTDGRRVFVVEDDRLMEALSGQTHMYLVRFGALIEETHQRAKKLHFSYPEKVRIRSKVFTLILTHDPEDAGYSAQCRELPGAIEQGDTAESAIENGKLAIESVLEFRRKHGRQRNIADG
jgi:predicted RNase H-like HicB family nuclease